MWRYVFLIGLTACGSGTSGSIPATPPVMPTIAAADPSVYIASFQALAAPHMPMGYKVTTTATLLGKLVSPTAAGECYYPTHNIGILQSWWDTANGDERQMVIYHELGHCELHRPHLTTLRPDGHPTSLMNTNATDWITYQTNQPYYDAELVSIINPCGSADFPCPRK